MNHPKRTLVLSAVTLSAVLVLTACGGSDGSGSMNGMQHNSMSSTTASSSPPAAATGTPATGAHNAADVQFATEMLPHHRQAVMMADMAATRAGNVQVKDLAATIKAAQAPEIEQLSGWLIGWGAPVPTSSGMGGMDHSSTPTDGMSGMMSDQEMQRMDAMSGAAFDKAFLTGMIAHHQGAVTMAKTELVDGSNPEAKTLAQAIQDSQSLEIIVMEKLLTQL